MNFSTGLARKRDMPLYAPLENMNRSIKRIEDDSGTVSERTMARVTVGIPFVAPFIRTVLCNTVRKSHTREFYHV